jgi:hypothetical protein
MSFTEQTIQNAYFCIQHDMSVKVDSCYSTLQFLLYLYFIQQEYKYPSLLYVKWCSG